MGHFLAPQLLPQLCSWIETRLGLHFPKERWGELERNVVNAALQLDYSSTGSYIAQLMSEHMSRDQFETLVSHLTIGETYFLREPRTFEALESAILPRLLSARRQSDKRLRIWSAGCCSGEEPYSVAILLDRLIPDHEVWNCCLLATDINSRFLDKAVVGVYGEWSFRGTPSSIRERYFDKTSDGRYELKPQIKRRVSFSFLNLADESYPSVINNTHSMDIIFCRNVLMYFSEPQAKKVVERLYRSLSDDGWLIVGPSEGHSVLFDLFTPVELSGTILYRKRNAGNRRIEVVGESLWLLVSEPDESEFADRERILVSESKRGRDQIMVRPQEVDYSRRARECADRGKLDEAADWCEKAIAVAKFNPAHRYLLASVRQEQGLLDVAAKSLQEAVYLDPDFVIAYFALGNLYRRQGRLQDAERHFGIVQLLLQRYPGEQILPESDGISADRLSNIVSHMLTDIRQRLGATSSVQSS